MSELVLEAHRLEDTPGTPVEDPAQIQALLGPLALGRERRT